MGVGRITRRQARERLDADRCQCAHIGAIENRNAAIAKAGRLAGNRFKEFLAVFGTERKPGCAARADLQITRQIEVIRPLPKFCAAKIRGSRACSTERRIVRVVNVVVDLALPKLGRQIPGESAEIVALRAQRNREIFKYGALLRLKSVGMDCAHGVVVAWAAEKAL